MELFYGSEFIFLKNVHFLVPSSDKAEEQGPSRTAEHPWYLDCGFTTPSFAEKAVSGGKGWISLGQMWAQTQEVRRPMGLSKT